MRWYSSALLGLVLACQSEPEGIYPQAGRITESVYASVTVQPQNLYRAHAAKAGILEAYLVEEGETVELGQPIAQISSSGPRLNVAQARLALEQARRNLQGPASPLQELDKQIQTARRQYQHDSLNFSRQQNLLKQGIGTQLEFNRRQLALEAADNTLQSLESRRLRTRTELQAYLEQAELDYQLALAASNDFRVSSKLAGKVYALYKEPGELVNPQEALAAMGSADSFIVEMLIDEVDITRLQPGQPVVLSLDAYPEQVFKARLAKIYPQKNERNQTFKVEAHFQQAPPRLYAGLSGEANIVVSQKEQALTIPRNYLLNNQQVLTDEGPRSISTGLQSRDRIEVTSGIDSTTLILKPE